jgi:cytochrome c peroxidase
MMISASGFRTLLFMAGFSAVTLIIFSQCNSRTSDTPAMTAEDIQLRDMALKFTSPMPENAFMDKPIHADLTELGKMLYYEPRISKSGLISCNTCHSLATFGVDMLPVSVGHGWQKGPINAPTVLNAAFHRTQFWDGRAADVEEQATMPILDELEMAATREHVIAVLASMPEYVERFSKAFPDQENPLIYDNVGVAIGAFERTLVTVSPFDKFLKGDPSALSADQKEGLRLFAETGCQACHRGQVLGGDIFAFFKSPAERANNTAHPGRFDFTGKESDLHFFKVPSLLNVAKTYPYFHDGSEWDLKTAVKVVGKDMLNKEFTEAETDLMMAFLESLTGEIPEWARLLPVLPPSTASTPRPEFDI